MPIDDILAYFARLRASDNSGPPALLFDGQGVSGCYRDLRLRSVFQPIFSADQQQAVAHEALLRIRGPQQENIPPNIAFARLEAGVEAVYFDRLCRIVHALNFANQAHPGADLFVNISGQHLLSISGGHGETFEHLLHLCGLKPSQIILEIIEAGVDDVQHLMAAAAAYRRRGYRIAIDDFGCEHSNFDRLWRLEPDIVKLDRSLLVEGIRNPRARRILPKLIDIVHDLGARVVCEGIETHEQCALARDAGADLLQGFLLGRPEPWLHNSQPATAAASSASAYAFS